ncbi:Tetraacyldisaccharide 4'-kinase [termite gut metagenome]|uniref:tetraacyldisaccharide 4'-kinase n=1 Tax=termite gut metagenome TaxID=433724 RepID=A0A5J4T1X6_9ZZZZ
MTERRSIAITKWLYPASFLYGTVVYLRNKLFDWNILQSKSYDIPVICVGNIAVGGTGKTPHIEYLIKLLRHEFNVAVLSRGYKRKTKGYILAGSQSNAQNIGDEPYQIKRKFPEVCVAVDEDRRHGINNLCGLKNQGIDVVLLDDAFQHRYIQAGINILLTDYHRLFVDDALLPAGRLRESVSGKNRAHIVIVTKCPQNIQSADYTIVAKRIGLYPCQQLYFSTFEYGDLIPVFPDNQVHDRRSLETVSVEESILLITGIASPVTMIEELKRYTRKIDILSFADHHDFSAKDIATIHQRFGNLDDNKGKIIITTEKDAARLISCPEIADEVKSRMYVLPIEVKFLKGQQNMFNKQIIDHVGKYKRNGFLYKKKNIVGA